MTKRFRWTYTDVKCPATSRLTMRDFEQLACLYPRTMRRFRLKPGKGEAKQTLRNHVASLVFGLVPVRHAVANLLSEVSVGYPDSPLNRSCDFEHSGPAPGKRAPLRDGEPRVGEGPTPRFALFAEETDALASVAREFADILEPTLRTPYDGSGLWLVRPDGYVALRAKSGDAQAVQEYLRVLRLQGDSFPPRNSHRIQTEIVGQTASLV
jgi:hypothetical protein